MFEIIHQKFAQYTSEGRGIALIKNGEKGKERKKRENIIMWNLQNIKSSRIQQQIHRYEASTDMKLFHSRSTSYISLFMHNVVYSL